MLGFGGRPTNDVRAPPPGHLHDAFNGDVGPGDRHDWRGGNVLDHGVERDVPPGDALPSLDIIEVREVIYDDLFSLATIDAHGTVKAGFYPLDLPEYLKTRSYETIHTYTYYGPVVVSDPSRDEDTDMGGFNPNDFDELGNDNDEAMEEMVPATTDYQSTAGHHGMSVAARARGHWIIDPAYQVMSQATEALQLLLLDPEMVQLRAQYNAVTLGGSRTVATLSGAMVARAIDWINIMATVLRDPRGLRLLDLIREIFSKIEAVEGFPGWNETQILQAVLSLAIHDNQRGWLRAAGVISEPESETIARAAIVLEQVAQCKYAAVSAELHRAGETVEFERFWVRMEAHTTGREVAATFAPARDAEHGDTRMRLVLMSSPTSEKGDDGITRKEIMATAVVTSAHEMRMQGLSRLVVSDLHRYMDAVQMRHFAIDYRIVRSLGLEQFFLNAARHGHYIARLFGLGHRSGRGGDDDDDDDEYWDTDWGSTFCVIIAPPGSRYFERLLECRVGPCNVLHLFQPPAAAPFGSVVRENIHKLVNEGGGIVLGDRRILELLMSDPHGSPGWRMGPTYLS